MPPKALSSDLTTESGLTISEFAEALNLPISAVISAVHKHRTDLNKPFYTYKDLKDRWRCSIGTVYNILDRYSARIVDFTDPGNKRGKKLVPLSEVSRIEKQRSVRLEPAAQKNQLTSMYA